MDHMEDVSSGAPPGLRSMGPPVEVRGRRVTREFIAREEGGEERCAVWCAVLEFIKVEISIMSVCRERPEAHVSQKSFPHTGAPHP